MLRFSAVGLLLGALACSSSARTIGASPADGGSSGGPPFLGTMDEVALYDLPLSQARIQAHFAAGKP